jgi:uncharacterized protein YkwD
MRAAGTTVALGHGPREGRGGRRAARAATLGFVLCWLLLWLIFAPGASAAVTHDAEELALLQQLNTYRQSHGLSPLLLSDRLSLTAERHATDMGKYRFFSHVTERSDWYPKGSQFWQRLEMDGYRADGSGENLAAGIASGAEAFQAWRNSPSHNATMLDPGGVRFKAIGIARVLVPGSPYLWYWATEFGTTVDGSARDPVAAPPGPFRDVPSTHPYAPAIQALSDKQVVNGFEDGNFAPAKAVLRQQFAKMIVGALNLPVSESDIPPFTDVESSGPGSLYPDNYIAVAAARGITAGVGGGRFAPKADVSRAQVITMVVRAAGREGLVLAPPPLSYASSWGDFSADHAANVRLAQFHGLLKGLPMSSLDPWAPMPRGEVAQVLHNLQGRLGR